MGLGAGLVVISKFWHIKYFLARGHLDVEEEL
jgi:hypothetical protein